MTDCMSITGQWARLQGCIVWTDWMQLTVQADSTTVCGSLSEMQQGYGGIARAGVNVNGV